MIPAHDLPGQHDVCGIIRVHFEQFVRVGELGTKLRDHFFTDFIATLLNRWAYGRDDPSWIRSEVTAHDADGFFGESLERTSPARMNGGDGAMFRIGEQN